MLKSHGTRPNQYTPLGFDGNNPDADESGVTGSGDELTGEVGKADVERYRGVSISKAISSMVEEAGFDEGVSGLQVDHLKKRKKKKKSKTNKDKSNQSSSDVKQATPAKPALNCIPYNYDDPTTTLTSSAASSSKHIKFDEDIDKSISKASNVKCIQFDNSDKSSTEASNSNITSEKSTNSKPDNKKKSNKCVTEKKKLTLIQLKNEKQAANGKINRSQLFLKAKKSLGCKAETFKVTVTNGVKNPSSKGKSKKKNKGKSKTSTASDEKEKSDATSSTNGTNEAEIKTKVKKRKLNQSEECAETSNVTSKKNQSQHLATEIKAKKRKKNSEADANSRSKLSAETVKANTDSEEIVGTSINPHYTEKYFKKKLKHAWAKDSEFDPELLPEDGKILTSPFQCCHLPQFVESSDDVLSRVTEQIRTLPMIEKNNDLYKFHQSQELPKVLSGRYAAFNELRTFLLGPVRKWLKRITGIPLNDTLDLSASLYKYTDTLLCHDDELEGRRIAFILYLSEDWQESDGGSLDLLSVDDAGNPDRVMERLYPRVNSFAFFEVSPVSYHQVSEILSRDRVRLSVSGWFHGPDIDRPPRPLPPVKYFSMPGDVDQKTLYSWINPLYLAESTQASIRRQFEKDSEIQLDEFIMPEERYTALCEQLTAVKSWKWAGPPNRVHYQVCESQELPPLVVEFVRVMRSEAVMLIMSQLTGLPLHHLYTDKSGDAVSETSSSDKFSDSDSNLSWDRQSNTEDEEYTSRHPPVFYSQIIEKHDLQMEQLKNENKLCDREDLTTKKKNKKKSNRTSLQKQWVQDNGFVDPSEVTKEASSSRIGQVYSSVRSLSHGCYSLMLDDDNMQLKQDSAKMNKSDDTKMKDSELKSPARSSAKKSRKFVKNAKADASNTAEDESEDGGGSFVLDCAVFCNVPEDGWSDDNGGHTTYVAEGGDELLTVTPRANSLALVYRDQHTFGFMKHINTRAADKRFHSIVCQYK